MDQYKARMMKIQCETCIGWGKVVKFRYGEEEKQTCPDCDGRGWTEQRLLVLVERAKKPVRRGRSKKRSWKNIPGVPEGF